VNAHQSYWNTFLPRNRSRCKPIRWGTVGHSQNNLTCRICMVVHASSCTRGWDQTPNLRRLR